MADSDNVGKRPLSSDSEDSTSPKRAKVDDTIFTDDIVVPSSVKTDVNDCVPEVKNCAVDDIDTNPKVDCTESKVCKSNDSNDLILEDDAILSKDSYGSENSESANLEEIRSDEPSELSSLEEVKNSENSEQGTLEESKSSEEIRSNSTKLDEADEVSQHDEVEENEKSQSSMDDESPMDMTQGKLAEEGKEVSQLDEKPSPLNDTEKLNNSISDVPNCHDNGSEEHDGKELDLSPRRSSRLQKKEYDWIKKSATIEKEAANQVQRLKKELRDHESRLMLLQLMFQSQRKTPQAPAKNSILPQKTNSVSTNRLQNVSAKSELLNKQDQSVRTTLPSNTSNRVVSGRESTQKEQMRVREQTKSLMVRQKELHIAAQKAQTEASSAASSAAQTARQAEELKNNREQRRALAKNTLRKQLEKQLLSMPAPKPSTQADMNFIPSIQAGDFAMLLGLEEITKHIGELEAIGRGQRMADVKYIFKPFSCVQCSTDFTPVWKRNRPGSKNVICETCVALNQKKTNREEAISRLKSTMSRAAQQEQEVERQLYSQEEQARVHAEQAKKAAEEKKVAASKSMQAASKASKAVADATRVHSHFDKKSSVSVKGNQGNRTSSEPRSVNSSSKTSQVQQGGMSAFQSMLGGLTPASIAAALHSLSASLGSTSSSGATPFAPNFNNMAAFMKQAGGLPPFMPLQQQMMNPFGLNPAAASAFSALGLSSYGLQGNAATSTSSSSSGSRSSSRVNNATSQQQQQRRQQQQQKQLFMNMLPRNMNPWKK